MLYNKNKIRQNEAKNKWQRRISHTQLMETLKDKIDIDVAVEDTKVLENI